MIFDFNGYKGDDPNRIKKFMTSRKMILRYTYPIMILSYWIGWHFASHESVPLFSYWITYLLTPMILFALYYRVYQYFFIRNWFYMLYIITTTLVFIATMWQIDYKYESWFLYELSHILIGNIIGVSIAVAVTLPFKLIYSVIFDDVEFYYNMNIVEKFEMEAFPEKIKKEQIKVKEASKYEFMNETLLNIELTTAIKEDRFEDAEKIKKLLETKFR